LGKNHEKPLDLVAVTVAWGSGCGTSNVTEGLWKDHFRSLAAMVDEKRVSPQCEAPKIAKLVYNSNNYGLWFL
jgi:hypothetical protein